ncbi:MAG: hypothetical protein ACYCX2_11565 [Christensenellales bacterium]
MGVPDIIQTQGVENFRALCSVLAVRGNRRLAALLHKEVIGHLSVPLSAL